MNLHTALIFRLIHFSFIILLDYTGIAQNVKTIKIDVNRSDQLRLSQIAAEIKMIPLEKTGDYEISDIWKVVLTKNFVFILASSEATNGWPEKVLQYNWAGKYIRQISFSDKQNNLYTRISDIDYDSSNETLILKSEDVTGVFNLEGIFKYSTKDIPDGYYYRNHIYFQDFYIKDENVKCNFLNFNQTDKTLQKIEIPPRNPGINKDSSSNRPVNYSENNGQLFVSFGYDLTIHRLNNSILTPVYRFDFVNCKLYSLKIAPAPKSFIFGDYLQYGYWVNNTSQGENIFIYNTKTEESYNIRLRKKEGKFVSGIEDNIYHTGYFTIGLTNQEGYVYYTKKISPLDQQNTQPLHTLFIIKLKNQK